MHLIAQLGIPDLLANGAKSTDELARATETHEPSLYRVLRALSAVGVLNEQPGHRFELTPVGALLKRGPGSMRGIVLWLNDPRHDRAWDEMLHSVRTGKTGAEKAWGMGIFEYLQKHPDFSEIFNDAMTSLSGNNVKAVVAGYDFAGIKKLMDVGGGHGALLEGILEKNPSMSGVIFDLPHVVEGARKSLKERGLDRRCEAVGGDFFKSVPSADAIIMSHIIHDWDEEHARKILESCRKALPPHGKVLLVETVVTPPNQFSTAKLLDLEMLVMAGGRERTEDEYRALFASAGLKLARVVPLPSGQSVLEATLG
jgi:hypothetical protein